jgi:hypothetical protein
MSQLVRDPQASRTCLIIALLALPVALQASVQESDLERILRRLHEYLETYEGRLSEIVADEVYEQRTTRPGPRRRVEMDPTGLPIPGSSAAASVDVTERRLQSTVSFMRLPGGAAWLGMRTVRVVDNREIGDSEGIVEVLRGASTTHALRQQYWCRQAFATISASRDRSICQLCRSSCSIVGIESE